MKVSILIPNDQQKRAKYFSSIQRGIEQSKMSNLAHVKKMTKQKSKKGFWGCECRHLGNTFCETFLETIFDKNFDVWRPKLNFEKGKKIHFLSSPHVDCWPKKMI